MYESETGFYYLGSRYYDPETGRFISADSYISTGQVMTGNNMFAYCLNNSINFYDVCGYWTCSIMIGANATLFLGASVAIGISFDGKGNVAVQWNYAYPGDDEVIYAGFFDVGAGITVQATKADTIYDLDGISSTIGASGGSGYVYVGGDVVSFTPVTESGGNIDGIQFTAGVGIGVDIHLAQTNTKTIKTLTFKEEKFSNDNVTINTKSDYVKDVLN